MRYIPKPSSVMEMVLPGNPSRVTHQQKGAAIQNGHIHYYTKKKVQDSKDELAAKLFKYIPKEPFDGPLQVFITWKFETKTKKQQRTPKTTKPDLDNLSKALLDVMTDLGFWKDDALISSLILRKGWVAPGEGQIVIVIQELEVET